MVKVHNLQNYLVVLLLFAVPINAAASYIISGLIFLLWILGGEYGKKLRTMLQDRLAVTFLLIFVLYLVGLLWTYDIQNGLKILSKQKLYLFAPVVISFFDKRFAKYAIAAFLAAMCISELYSLYLYFTVPITEEGSLPSPFMHHMHFSLILAFTFGYLVSEIDFKKLGERKMRFYLLFALLTLVVLFVNKGRIGQVALLAVFFILAVGKFRLSLLKSLVTVAVGSMLLFLSAYQLSDQFRQRVDKASYEFHEVVGTGKRDSIACRFEMWEYAVTIGEKSPLLGAGTGDGIYEMNLLLGKEGFDDLYRSCGLGLRYLFNPHNNFLFYFMLFGSVGVLLIVSILLYQFYIAWRVRSLGMTILLTVTVVGMMTASPISVHVKYIFFYTMMLTMLYLDALAKRGE